MSDYLGGQIVLAGVLVASALLMPFTPLGLMVRRFAKPLVANRLNWAGLLCMELISSLMVLTLVGDATLLLLWGVNLFAPGWLDSWRTLSAQAVHLLAALATLLGLLNARPRWCASMCQATACHPPGRVLLWIKSATCMSSRPFGSSLCAALLTG